MVNTDWLNKLPGEVRQLLVTHMSSPAQPYYENYAEELIYSIMKELSTLNDPVAIYRAQGKIEGIRLLLGLKDTLLPKQPQRTQGRY